MDNSVLSENRFDANLGKLIFTQFLCRDPIFAKRMFAHRSWVVNYYQMYFGTELPLGTFTVVGCD